MKFTYRWLQDHLDTTASPEALAETLTRIGLEVESLDDLGARYAPFRVARIREARPHPDADRLKVCTVDAGEEDTLQIVCGAANARDGLTVVLAPVGTEIPENGMVIRQSAIRGVESQGMLCSAAELGLGGDAEGILELSDAEDLTPGAPFAPFYGLDDTVFDIAVTPNRGDCLGVRGIARDLAAAGMGSLKPLPHRLAEVTGGAASSVQVRIEDADGCRHFVGCEIRNVRNDAAPEWMQRRLHRIGQQTLSALVDITNYISVDLGRPLHVYDADKLQGDIVVRAAREGETFTALDNREYVLSEGMIAIADDTGVIGLGGIIGGVSTRCTETTKNVFIEAAWFDPVRIAETGRALQIDSDARARFERRVDPASTESGAQIAVQMVLDACGGEAGTLITAGAAPLTPRRVAFDTHRIAALGGISIPPERTTGMLEALGFAPEEGRGDGMLDVTVPSWRGDIEQDADLVEEVLRLEGLDRIPSAPLPATRSASADGGVAKLPVSRQRIRRFRRILAARGVQEVRSWSFISAAMAARFGGGKNPALQLLNPIHAEMDTLRPSLLPNLLGIAARNANRGYRNVALCEYGTRFLGPEPENQRPAAAAIRTGEALPKHVQGDTRTVDIFDAKADVALLLAATGLDIEKAQLDTRDLPGYWHPGRSAAIRLGKTVLGYFGEVHPAVRRACDLEETAVGFELYMDALPVPRAGKHGATRPPLDVPELQPVCRDFAFIVDADVQAHSLVRTIGGVDKALIRDVRVFDVYQGKGVEDGKKSIALNVTLQPRDATLTDAALETLSRTIVDTVAKRTGAVLR